MADRKVTIELNVTLTIIVSEGVSISEQVIPNLGIQYCSEDDMDAMVDDFTIDNYEITDSR